MSGTDLQASLTALAEHEARVQSGPLTRLMRRLGRTAQFAAVYRRVGPVIDPRIAHINDGRFMAKLYGFPVLILHTTGAKSGLPRSSPLLYVRDGDDGDHAAMLRRALSGTGAAARCR